MQQHETSSSNHLKSKELSSFTVNKLNLDGPDLSLPGKAANSEPTATTSNKLCSGGQNRDLVMISMLSSGLGDSIELTEQIDPSHDDNLLNPLRIVVKKSKTNKIAKSNSGSSHMGDESVNSDNTGRKSTNKKKKKMLVLNKNQINFNSIIND